MSRPLRTEIKDGVVVIRGDTFPLRGIIKRAGGGYDRERRRSWVPLNARDRIEKIVRAMNTALQETQATPVLDRPLLGWVMFRDRQWYVLACDNARLHLVNRTGTADFWAQKRNCSSITPYAAKRTLRDHLVADIPRVSFNIESSELRKDKEDAGSE